LYKPFREEELLDALDAALNHSSDHKAQINRSDS